MTNEKENDGGRQAFIEHHYFLGVVLSSFVSLGPRQTPEVSAVLSAASHREKLRSRKAKVLVQGSLLLGDRSEISTQRSGCRLRLTPTTTAGKRATSWEALDSSLTASEGGRAAGPI